MCQSSVCGTVCFVALSRLAPCASAPVRLGRVVLLFFRPQCGGPCVDLVVPSATHATASLAQVKVSVIS